MLIPFGTNRPARRTPIVTQSLIVVNLLVYLGGLMGDAAGLWSLSDINAWGRFSPQQPSVQALVTYQFMHDASGIGHIAFNMLFLWVFGAAVEDRLGRLGFLCFYLMGGAIAALAHMMVAPQASVIGASGSIAAVTGAFLAFFPRSRIKILFFLFLIGIYQIPALWFVGFYFIVDLLRQGREILGGGGSNVAYAAHIAGYLWGFLLGFALLGLRVLKHEDFDVFFLFRQARRRAAFRAASRQTGGLWESASADTGRGLEKESKKRRAEPATAPDPRRVALRKQIGRCVEEHDLPAAAAKYRELLEIDPAVVLSERHQLDMGNQLFAEGDAERAARAYEQILEHYRASGHVPEVSLMLGLIYTRRITRPDRARELLTRARPRLSDTDQRALADELLAELSA